MKISPNESCPCHSKTKYKKCCKIYHDKKAHPKTAEKLMRSRYSAFALENADYIIATTHPSHPEFTTKTREWKASIKSFCQNTAFQNLRILQHEDHGDSAAVTFCATLFSGGKDASFCEKSDFVKEDNRWYYTNGTMIKDEKCD